MSSLVADFTVVRADGFSVEVQFELAPGETVAVLGPNGAGKTTVVSALAGHIQVDSGEITFAGRMLDDGGRCFVPPDRRGIGVVFQDYLLFENMTVLDNIAFGPRLTSSKGAARSVAQAWVERLGLRGTEHKRPAELSGGQAQRVALARTLVTHPAALLLDEPLAALDVVTRHELRSVLGAHLAEMAGPRLVITHDPVDAFLLADRIVVLEGGKIVQSGAPEEIRRSPATSYVAALSGTNLYQGSASQGSVHIESGEQVLTIADQDLEGSVLLTIDPAAVALYPQRPQGSPRNTWEATVVSSESRSGVVRLQLAGPVPIMVDITAGSAEALELGPGSVVWASVKATEISVRVD